MSSSTIGRRGAPAEGPYVLDLTVLVQVMGSTRRSPYGAGWDTARFAIAATT
jgi:hypothetical protein